MIVERGVSGLGAGIFDTIKSYAEKLLPSGITDALNAKRAKIDAERALYAGHQVSWWAARGLAPGDTAGLARQRAQANAAEAAMMLKQKGYTAEGNAVITALKQPPQLPIFSDMTSKGGGGASGPGGPSPFPADNPYAATDSGAPSPEVKRSGLNPMMIAAIAAAGLGAFFLLRKRR